MTLATLKGMNFNIGDVANAIKLKAADSMYSGVQKVSERASSTAKHLSDAASGYMGTEAKAADGKASKTAAAGGFIDPMQLWGSLTQQFQAIAAGAIKEATTKTAMDVTKNMATGLAKEAIKSAKAAASAPAQKRPAAKKPSAKVVTKKPLTR